ncbi:HNH endonuclease signature motif containing protein [Williamsia sp. M5A3_1d]
MIALSRRESRLSCQCGDCVTLPNDIGPGTEASEGPTPLHARPTFHIVANLSTLLGLDDQPGFLDGHGVIDADTMRSLLAEAHREFIRPEPPASNATGYTPSRKLQAPIRTGELCCTFPGCSSPVWTTDLDHTDPFDHRDPHEGGRTDRSNLKPLCRFHHRLKTFTAWRDFQDAMGTVLFQSPTGHMFLGNAYTGTDLFSALRSPPGRADHPARRHLDELRIRQRDAHRRAVEHARLDEPDPPF